jgi:hypothetical protein
MTSELPSRKLEGYNHSPLRRGGGVGGGTGPTVADEASHP